VVCQPKLLNQYRINCGSISCVVPLQKRPFRIVQRWREKSWPDGMFKVSCMLLVVHSPHTLHSSIIYMTQFPPTGHHSTVTIVLKQESDCTKLVLSQTEVPDNDAERTKEGWKRYIFESIKSTFGFGARLL